ncbi:hypothetical protein [Croceicoccus gelatinilyticus]|uniref:hypothetical protein n=1 Tax=Croceicoccus gelatinilyticus TaxID=2835536 RepID=UPI001BD08CCA|nr:hypothetical protein [Croceicoccus gelatinilyticus]MBS7670871.1 hypothetical protein [Croceicoccus gelatinilyticus]
MRLGVAFLALALAGCAAGGPSRGGPGGPDLKPIAQPGDVVAAELAFASMAQEEGQWTAFREYAAEDGVMFVPELVNAKDWLKKRENPAQSVAWQPHEVWSSCDGSVNVTRGAWQRPDGSTGWFTTVWQRQKDGEYRWLMDHGDTLTKPLTQPDLIDAHVADCPELPWPPAQELLEAVPGNGEFFGGSSDDRTLRWGGRVDQWGGRIVTVDVWDGGQFQRVLHQTVAPPKADH